MDRRPDPGFGQCGSGALRQHCDILIVAGNDLRIMVYTAEPDTADAERLASAIVVGTRVLIE